MKSYEALTDDELNMQEIFLRKELWKRRYAKDRERNKWQVGKCFIYLNSYGVSDDCRRWPLYAQVERLDDTGKPNGWTFERTTRDCVDFRFNQVLSIDGWTEVSRGTFNKAYRALVKQLLAMVASVKIARKPK